MPTLPQQVQNNAQVAANPVQYGSQLIPPEPKLLPAGARQPPIGPPSLDDTIAQLSASIAADNAAGPPDFISTQKQIYGDLAANMPQLFADAGGPTINERLGMFAIALRSPAGALDLLKARQMKEAEMARTRAQIFGESAHIAAQMTNANSQMKLARYQMLGTMLDAKVRQEQLTLQQNEAAAQNAVRAATIQHMRASDARAARADARDAETDAFNRRVMESFLPGGGGTVGGGFGPAPTAPMPQEPASPPPGAPPNYQPPWFGDMTERTPTGNDVVFQSAPQRQMTVGPNGPSFTIKPGAQETIGEMAYKIFLSRSNSTMPTSFADAYKEAVNAWRAMQGYPPLAPESPVDPGALVGNYLQSAPPLTTTEPYPRSDLNNSDW